VHGWGRARKLGRHDSRPSAAEGFHVYAPDLLGYGRSAKPDVAYSVGLEEGVVVDFMRAVGLQRTDVDGWSMAGGIAAKMALDHPEMVNRLVLDDSAGLKYQVSFNSTAFCSHGQGFARPADRAADTEAAHDAGICDAGNIAQAKREGKIIQQSMDAMLSGRDLLDGLLSNIAQPTLIAWGPRTS